MPKLKKRWIVIKSSKLPIGRGSLASQALFTSKEEAQKQIDFWNKSPQHRYLKLRPTIFMVPKTFKGNYTYQLARLIASKKKRKVKL